VDLDRKDDTNDLEECILKLGIDGSVVRELKNGINSDINRSSIKDLNDLLKYSYKVAGCVGLMMCDVLSIKSTLARYYAIDLGIAMQITNICRDVLIDYRGGRVYLPSTLLGDNEISSMTDAEILSVVTKLIKLADDYYNSALNGIKLIPIRSRFSILYALRLYQAIGHKYFKEKINTTLSEKIIIFFKSFFEFMTMSLRQSNRKQHNQTLHKSLQGLPYVNETV
jgi:phytoene synthase